MKKERIDVLLVNQGFFSSRERARAEIMAGKILVNMQKIDKAGTMVPADAQIKIVGNTLQYVSRGGLKLEKAVKVFAIELQDKVVADIGASTGGFTDCALQNGASRVYAVDVGYGQLAWSLRTDERVINMERTNVRNLTAADLGESVDLATIDVAFISLDKIMANVKSLLKPTARIMALIKPQFEAGREAVGKKGVVRDAAVHIQVIENVLAMTAALDLKVLGLSFSPIKGPEGNIEYLLYLTNDAAAPEEAVDVRAVVAEAHGSLSS